MGYPKRAFEPIEGLMADHHISFNFRRPSSTFNDFPRKVTILPIGGSLCLVVPGVNKKRETLLIAELKNIQNWKTVTRYAYEISPEFYSFLWRFNVRGGLEKNRLRPLNPFPAKAAKMIRSAFKQYQAALRQNLAPGQVYLVPDQEVAFQNEERYKQPYARPVLVVNARGEDLEFMPFSRKTERMDPVVDILFDSGDAAGSLDADARPAVESFPYAIFRTKVALMVSAAQPMPLERFIQIALVPRGSVRPEVLKVAQLRLKKI